MCENGSPVKAMKQVLEILKHDLSSKKLLFELKVEQIREVSITFDRRRFK